MFTAVIITQYSLSQYFGMNEEGKKIINYPEMWGIWKPDHTHVPDPSEECFIPTQLHSSLGCVWLDWLNDFQRLPRLWEKIPPQAK